LVLTSTSIGIAPEGTLFAEKVLLSDEYFSQVGRRLPSIPLAVNLSPPAASTTSAGMGKLNGLPDDTIFSGTETEILPGRSAAARRTSATIISSSVSFDAST
jgi:hypothetical protein